MLAAVPVVTIAGPPGLEGRKTMDVGERVDRLTEALELDAAQAFQFKPRCERRCG